MPRNAPNLKNKLNSGNQFFIFGRGGGEVGERFNSSILGGTHCVRDSDIYIYIYTYIYIHIYIIVTT